MVSFTSHIWKELAKGHGECGEEKVKLNQVFTEEINKKVLKTLSVHKPLSSEHKPSIN